MRERAIYFDMDGTIANLYGFDGWLDFLHAENVEPYAACEPCVNVQKFITIVRDLQAKGYTIGVISWGAMGGSREYTRAVKRAKVEWLRKWFADVFTEIHVIKYGTPKFSVAKIKNAILVDDNADVRHKWHGLTIDATNKKEMLGHLARLAAWETRTAVR